MRRALVLAALCTVTLPALAEKPAGLQPIPEPPPIATDAQGQDETPQVTITKRGEDRVEEYRIRGKLYMIKVTPPHGVPYYLVDNKGDGNFTREEQDTGLRVPLWVIKSW